MKHHSIHSIRSGFTLVELLVVIAILMTLAGIGGTAFVGIQESTKKQKNKTFLKQLETSLQDYHLDFGAYPIATNTSGDNSDRLYKCLFEGTDPDGNNASTSTSTKATIYAPYLDENKGDSAYDQDSGKILDPYGNPYLYLDAANHSSAENPDFDLWSRGKNDEEAETQDDITNWV